TYTVLKKLCDKGFIENTNSTVRVLVDRESYQASQSRQFVEETFEGSLPAFLNAFSAGRKLSEKEVEEIRQMLDSVSEKGD
ncbi:MAG: BlaI/MecI/CopY family transcriptional regulator, partial [Lachnospiraceae bacterium]|nr:BlaI/MecI/CopY family transcriptional regulator [Lachnospiraceae bacterium]